MTQVQDFFDELGFSEAEASGFEWRDGDLVVDFSRGVDISDPGHPLFESFEMQRSCRLRFENVIESRLTISRSEDSGVTFLKVTPESPPLPKPQDGKEYKEYFIEGSIDWENKPCWFTWEISAARFVFDDLR